MKPSKTPHSGGYKPIPDLSPERYRLFRAKFDVGDGCWNWKASPKGRYGYFAIDGSNFPAHRVAYSVANNGLKVFGEIDHLCFNTRCVNPSHLEPVTHAINVERYVARNTHCPAGHVLSEENTYRPPSGGRKCKTCTRERDERKYEAANPGHGRHNSRKEACWRGHPFDAISVRGQRRLCGECRNIKAQIDYVTLLAKTGKTPARCPWYTDEWKRLRAEEKA